MSDDPTQPQSPRTDAAPAIDQAVLARLREDTGDDDGELIEELVQVFAEEATTVAATLLATADAADDEGTMGAAHKLKSGAANLGAEALRALCEALEHAGRDRRSAEIPPLAAQLPATLEAAVAGLQDYLASIGRGPQRAAS